MNHREARCKTVECCSTFTGEGPAWGTCGQNGKRQRLSCPCARLYGRWGIDGVGPSFLASALDKGEWPASCDGRIIPLERAPH